jgi:phosphoglycerate kinase
VKVFLKTIRDINVLGKTVVVRCDFNVPVEDGVIKDNSKIVKSLKTIKYLLDNNAKVVLLSHFGRVKTLEDKKKNTLKPVAKELANLLGRKVIFVDKCYGDKVRDAVLKASLGDVILLENTRFMDVLGKKESNNDLELAEFFASLGDVYINDAFASMHRAHASTAGIAKFIEHGVGFLVAEELNKLNILIENTPHPFGVFMGGAKVDDKLPIIKELIKRCDYLLLGGGIANSFLKAIGADVGGSVATSDLNILEQLKEIMNNYKDKIILPIDFTLDDGIIYDIGKKSIELYKTYIDKCNIFFVNGTCGKFEDDRFKEGTEELFKVLSEASCKVIVGGGDTASAVKKFGYLDKFSYVSSGGGATLEYIANKKLAALDWMKE